MAALTTATLLPCPPSAASGRRAPIAPRINYCPSRRHLLLLSASPLALVAAPPSSQAKDIPLFGIRKKVEQVEEIVKEGEKALEGGIEAAEKEVMAVEKEIEEAEGKVEQELLIGGGPVQAAAVAGAEAVGVLVGVSIVNSILGSEVRKSQG